MRTTKYKINEGSLVVNTEIIDLQIMPFIPSEMTGIKLAFVYNMIF